MRRILAPLIVFGSVGIAVLGLAFAGPGLGISKTAPISGTGSSGDPLKLDVCASGSAYISNGTSWECGSPGQTYTAGTGLSESPTGTFNVNIVGTGGTCPAGTAVNSLTATGTAGCGASIGTGDIEGVTTTAPLSGGCTSGTCALTTSMATSRLLGRITASTGVAEELTGTQATTLLDLFSTSGTTKGLVSGSSSASTACLKGNNTWGPCGGSRATATWSGTVNNYSVTSTTDVIEANLTGDTTLTGLDGCTTLGDTVDIVYTHASSSGYTLTLENLSGSSTLGNRFFYDDGNVVLERGSGVHLRCAAVAGSDVTNGNYWIVTEPPAGGGAADGLGPDGDKGDATVGGSGTTLSIDDDAIQANHILDGEVGVGELANDLDLSGNGSTTVGDVRCKSQEVATTGTINDLSVNSDTCMLIFTGGSSITLNGMTGGATDRCVVVKASTTSGAGVAITHENAGSTAANRNLTANNSTWTLSSNAMVLACYESADSRWHWAFNQRFPGITVTASASLTSAQFSGTVGLNATTNIGDGDSDVATLRMPKDDGTPPTLSSCGTGPSVTGGSWAFTVTGGSGATGCTATFAATKTNPPTCTITHRDGAVPPYTVSATAISWTFVTNASEIFDVICIGDG